MAELRDARAEKRVTECHSNVFIGTWSATVQRSIVTDDVKEPQALPEP